MHAARLLRNALNQLTSPLLSLAFTHWADDWRVCSDAEREAARERRLALQEEELRELRAALALSMEEGEEEVEERGTGTVTGRGTGRGRPS